MKKFIARILLALLPFGVYLGFFVAFEPNNYFGLRSDDTMFSRIISYTQNKPQSIIIGDSRLAHFDMNLVNQAAQRPIHNLAFGGATFEEILDLLEYSIEQNKNLNEVIVGLSFYNINKSYGTVSRMATIEKQIENPFAYIFNFQYNIDAAVAFVNTIKGVPLGAENETAIWSEEDYIQNGNKLDYRKNLIAYSALLYSNCAVPGALPSALSSMDAMMQGIENGTLSAQKLMQEMLDATPAQSRFEVNQKQLDRLVEIAALCKQKNISLTVVLPPMHESVRQLVCEPLGIDTQMIEAIELLRQNGIEVMDYEWQNAPNYPDDAYFDGFHLDLKYGLPQWTKELFGNI